MTNRSRLAIIRPIGVAVVSLLLIVGGAFAANGLAGTVAPRSDDFNAAATAKPSESPEPTESPEATVSNQALDISPLATDDHDALGDEDATESLEASDDSGDDDGSDQMESDDQHVGGDSSSEPTDDHDDHD